MQITIIIIIIIIIICIKIIMIIIISSIILLLLSLLLRPPANKYLLGSITQIPIRILYTLECLGFLRNNHTKLGLSVIRTASLRSWRTVGDFARVKISATKLQEILKRLFSILRPAQQLFCQKSVRETGIYKQHAMNQAFYETHLSYRLSSYSI